MIDIVNVKEEDKDEFYVKLSDLEERVSRLESSLDKTREVHQRLGIVLASIVVNIIIYSILSLIAG